MNTTPLFDVFQDAFDQAQARFAAETGSTGEVTILLALPDAPPPESGPLTVGVTVIDKATGEQRAYD
jgi:hypothetical protein